MAASCSEAPIQGPDAGELYDRNFIAEFGVPAKGHDFSMATRAGLTVNSTKGTQLIVTAEVDGREYLFANLSVPAGTNAIPVTIPRSVTTLKLTTPRGSQVVGANSTVNLDRIGEEMAGRGGNYYLKESGRYLFFSDGADFFEVVDGTKTSTDDSDAPLVAINPRVIADFFAEFPLGADNTNHEIFDKDGDGVIDIFAEELPEQPYFNGETGMGDGGWSLYGFDGCSYDYYIFPVWWRADADGSRDYTAYLFDKNLRYLSNGWDDSELRWMPDFGASTSTLPFPDLRYSTTVTDATTINPLTLEGFTAGDGSLTDAFNLNGEVSNLDGISMIVSRGIKLNTTGTYGTLGFAVEHTVKGVKSVSTSIPVVNKLLWGGNYFDEKLEYLYYANSSTRHTSKNSLDIYLRETGKADDAKGWYYPGDDFGAEFVCFNSAPSAVADRSKRDYSDVIFMILPVPKKYPDEPEVNIQWFEWVHTFGKILTPLTWTIAAEDLGGSDDWDFNDAVFTFTDVIQNLNSINKNCFAANYNGPDDAVNVRVITVTPRASGGTLPLYITYEGEDVYTMPSMPVDGDRWYSDVNDAIKEHLAQGGRKGTFIIGTELHHWLGASTHAKPVNVGARRNSYGAQAVQFALPTGADVWSQTVYGNQTSAENRTVGSFGILVDRENTIAINNLSNTDNGITHMPDHKLGEGIYKIGGISDDATRVAPQMLLISGDWEWPQERVRITDAYNGFADWLSNPSAYTWTANQNPGRVTRK